MIAASTLSHSDVTMLLLSLGVLLGLARAFGEVCRRFNQPSVIGELLAGIVLGPTVLGALWPDGFAALFPREGNLPIALQGLTTIAITLFLLVAGLEVDLSTIWRRRRAAFRLGLFGMLIPFAATLPVGLLLPARLDAGPEVTRTLFALFLATAMSISALPVIAKILIDLRLFRSDMGMMVIAAAVFNDLVGWLVFAVILASAGHAASGGFPVWMSIVLTLIFVLGMLTVGRILIDRALPWIQAHTSWPAGVLAFAMVLGILSAAFTEWIGVHAIFGAFIFGVALGDSRHLRANTRTTIDHFISFIFAPIFFASIGLRVDFLRNFDLPLVVLVLVLATVGKVGGSLLAARASGTGRRESWAIGFALNARGAMEIILGLIALEAGLIGERLFVALVIMALVTSMTAGSLVQFVLGRQRVVSFANHASPRTFLPSLEARTRRDAIAELARAAAEAAGIDARAVEDTVWNRERVVGSAMTNGVAIPQARLSGLSHPIVAVGISRAGIDFDAPDGQPVRLILLLLTPKSEAALQLRLLASMARAFQEARLVDRVVEQCRTWTEFLALIRTEVEQRAGGGNGA